MIPPQYHCLLIYFFVIGEGFSVFYTPVPFYHRYMLLCKWVVEFFMITTNAPIFRDVSLTRRSILAILLIPVSLTLWICSWQLFSMLQTDQTQLLQAMNNSMWVGSDGQIPMFYALRLVSRGGLEGVLDFCFFELLKMFSIFSKLKSFPTFIPKMFQDTVPSQIYLNTVNVAFPLSYGLPFYFFSKIYKNFKEHQPTMTGRAVKLHKALNKALISQVRVKRNKNSRKEGLLTKVRYDSFLGPTPICSWLFAYYHCDDHVVAESRHSLLAQHCRLFCLVVRNCVGVKIMLFHGSQNEVAL